MSGRKLGEPYTLTHLLVRLAPAMLIGLALGSAAGIIGGQYGLVIVLVAGAVMTLVGLVAFGPWPMPTALRQLIQYPGSEPAPPGGIMDSLALLWAFTSSDPTNPCERLIFVYLAYRAEAEGTTGTLHRATADLQELASWARVDLKEITHALDALVRSGLLTVAKPRDADHAPAYYLTRIPAV